MVRLVGRSVKAEKEKTMSQGTLTTRASAVPLDHRPETLKGSYQQTREYNEPIALKRANRLMIAFLILMGVIYILRVGPPAMYPAWGFDSSISLVSAKALSEGQGLRLINHPEAPFSPYVSIGYPAMLALGLRFVTLDAVGLTVLRSISVVTCLIFLFLGYHLLRRYVSPTVAAITMLFIGFQPWVVVWAGELFRECPFAMWATAAVLLVKKSEDEESKTGGRWRRNFIFAGIFAGFGMLTHTLGLTLIAGIAVALAVNRKWRSLIVFAISSGLTVAPWTIWSMFFVHSGSSVANYMSWASSYYHWWTPFQNLWRLFTEEGAIILFPPYGTADGLFILQGAHIAWLFPLLSLIISAVFLAGLYVLLKRRDVVAWCLIFYLSLVVLYPAGATRYLMPVYALMAIPLLVGGRLLKEGRERLHIPARALRISTAALLVILTLGSLVTNSLRISSVYTYGHFYGAWGAKNWKELTTGFDWIKQNVPENGVVVTLYSCSVYLFTDRLTISPYHDATDSTAPPGSAARLQEVLSKIDPNTPLFIFARPFIFENEDISTTSVKDFVSENPERVRLRWETPDHKMTIYEVIRPGGS